MNQQTLKSLETPDFARAYALLQPVHHTLLTVGAVDFYLRIALNDAPAADAWSAYRAVEDLIP